MVILFSYLESMSDAICSVDPPPLPLMEWMSGGRKVAHMSSDAKTLRAACDGPTSAWQERTLSPPPPNTRQTQSVDPPPPPAPRGGGSPGPCPLRRPPPSRKLAPKCRTIGAKGALRQICLNH